MGSKHKIIASVLAFLLTSLPAFSQVDTLLLCDTVRIATSRASDIHIGDDEVVSITAYTSGCVQVSANSIDLVSYRGLMLVYLGIAPRFPMVVVPCGPLPLVPVLFPFPINWLLPYLKKFIIHAGFYQQ